MSIDKKLDKIVDFIKKHFSYLLIICFCATFLFISLKNMFLIFAIFILGIYFFQKKFKVKKFTIFLFVISFLVRLLAILFVKTPIISDFAVMYNTAVEILNGDMSYINESLYFNKWGYQMGHTMYMYFLLKLFNSVTFLKIINCLVTSLVTVLIYLISKELSSEKSSRIISLIYCFFPFPLLLNTVLTNQHVPALLILLGFYLTIGKKFLKMNYIFKYIIVGILIAFSNVLRSEGIVFIASFIIYFILQIRKDNFKKVITKLLVLIVTYFLVFNGCSYALKVTGYSKIGLENKNVLWKFVVGLNHDTNGGYNNEDAVKYSNIGNDDIKIEVIKERTLGDIYDLPRLFLAKSTILWRNSNLYWSLCHLDGMRVEKLGFSISGNLIVEKLVEFNQYFIDLVLILMLIGVAPNKKKSISDNKNLLVIVLLMFFAIYLLIEIMPRYAYSPQLFVFILASIGLDKVIKYLNHKKII